MSTHQQITDSIVAAIEAGADGSGFKMPWHRSSGRPENVSSCRSYTGVNTLNLWCEEQFKGFSTSTWGTLKQWNQAGAKVKKGEKSAIVIFYKPLPEKEDDEPHDRRFVMRTSRVFNADQVDGFEPESVVLEDHTPHRPTDQFVAATGADVCFGGGRAFYNWAKDFIQLPPMDRFHDVQGFYSVLLHELSHWTGHDHRLAREFGERFGTEAYAFEELIAELSAAFLCADLGVSNEPRPDHAEYVAGWLRILKSDQRAIFTAAAQAQKAVEFLHSLATNKEKSAA
ncbi:ArdC family protein [Roseinatronobacter sp.]|uniref:ArdC family protein n=1 Tax=Roseinatronobacter sp. TaxID=1945755 RepID=UPI0025ED63D1|nr:zincin-like metallopeptidase domain-containing protein [Roseibaca sp.]